MKSQSLPVVIQSVVARENNGDYEFLLLKRSEKKGGFWNSVNGTLEINESVFECRERELYEEAGIKETISWTDELIRFNFTYDDYTFSTVAYGVVVPANTEVVLNEEHTEYKWLSADGAIELLKFKEDKEAIISLLEIIKK